MSGDLGELAALADQWEREADEILDSEGKDCDGPSAAMVGVARGRHECAVELRAALARQRAVEDWAHGHLHGIAARK